MDVTLIWSEEVIERCPLCPTMSANGRNDHRDSPSAASAASALGSFANGSSGTSEHEAVLPGWRAEPWLDTQNHGAPIALVSRDVVDVRDATFGYRAATESGLVETRVFEEVEFPSEIRQLCDDSRSRWQRQKHFAGIPGLCTPCIAWFL